MKNQFTACEYFVNYNDFGKALNAIFDIREKFINDFVFSDIRIVGPDNIPFSPCKGRRAISINLSFLLKCSISLKLG